MKATNLAAPEWLRVSENDEEVITMSSGTSTSNKNFGSSNFGSKLAIITNSPISITFWTLKVFTILLCILMFATSIIGVQYINGVETSGKIFVATYMFFFSLLLFSFEVVQIWPVEWIDHIYRRNFGFLYGALGKSFFIIFIAFLSFGLDEPQSLTIMTGVIWACFGGIQVALYLKYPEWFDTDESTPKEVTPKS
eukprot:gene25443-33993_t